MAPSNSDHSMGGRYDKTESRMEILHYFYFCVRDPGNGDGPCPSDAIEEETEDPT